MKHKNTTFVIIAILIIIVASVSSIFLYNKEHKVDENKKAVKELIKETATIQAFKEKLEENDIVIDEETVDGESGLIGAAEGVSYKIENERIQVYRFDLDKTDELTVENLKKAQEEEKVVMPSFNNFEIKVKYNKGLVLINSENHPQKEKIIEIFESL